MKRVSVSVFELPTLLGMPQYVEYDSIYYLLLLRRRREVVGVLSGTS